VVEATAATPAVVLRDEDVAEVLAELGETFDVSPEDLQELVRRLEARLLLTSRVAAHHAILPASGASPPTRSPTSVSSAR
jgi:CBS-domain-containing membrane protein